MNCSFLWFCLTLAQLMIQRIFDRSTLDFCKVILLIPSGCFWNTLSCNEANSFFSCSCILFDTITIPASIWGFGCHVQTWFYQWVQHIQLFSNLRTSVLVCIPSAGSKSTIIHTFISFMVSVRPWSQTCPIRNTEFERAFVGDQISTLPTMTKQNVQPNEIR